MLPVVENQQTFFLVYYGVKWEGKDLIAIKASEEEAKKFLACWIETRTKIGMLHSGYVEVRKVEGFLGAEPDSIGDIGDLLYEDYWPFQKIRS